MTVAAPPRRRASARSRAARQARPQTLAVALDWIEAHCIIPDGFRKGAPLVLYEWQIRFLGNHYLVRPDAAWDPAQPVLGPAFVHSRSGMVGPQKLGKDPMEAAHICLEGVGPALFAGWAGKDQGFACRDHGCRCGWERPYRMGEPRGMPWPTPLIQITAVSEDATDNTYDVLRPMIDDGPLHDLIPKTSEEFIRLPHRGRIDVVTASARSRLGQRVTFVSQGEAALYTQRNGMIGLADTQYRGLAGMGGRAAWHTNAWDPAEASLARRESTTPGVYVQFDRPPAGLAFTRRDERQRIYRAVYPREVRREHGGHVDIDSIEAEATKILAHDPAQAARFFGNQLVPGTGAAFDPDRWGSLGQAVAPDEGAMITLGFDGSRTGDHTALIGCAVETGAIWPVGIWDPEAHGGEVPRDIVDAEVDRAHATWRVVRMYADPPYWREELAAWQGRYGDKVVIKWETWRNRPMGFACRSFATAITSGAIAHSGDPALAAHVGACQRRPLNERDDAGKNLWTVQKETPDSARKIDAAVAAILAWEARMDAIAAGLPTEAGPSVYETRGPLVFGADDEEDDPWHSLGASGLLVRSSDAPSRTS